MTRLEIYKTVSVFLLLGFMTTTLAGGFMHWAGAEVGVFTAAVGVSGVVILIGIEKIRRRRG